MKKIILSEEQLRRVIDNVVSEQSETESGENITQNSWRLCGKKVIEENGRYYATDRTGRIEIPFLDELKGTITGRGRNAELVFDELTKNGLYVGSIMKKECGVGNSMQYSGAYGWVCYVVRNGYDIRKNQSTGRDEKVKLDAYPAYGAFYSYANNNKKTIEGYSIETELVKQREGAIVQWRKTRTEDFLIEVSPAMMGDFIEPEIPKTITPPSKKEPTVVQLDIESPFEFDKVTLTPEAEQKFKQFVQDIKTNYQGVKGDVEVICSASIDADPAKKAQYNQKLSENRAITIVNRLKNETGITTLNFIPKGIGQTSQFAPELKWPEVTDESKTAPNRRLIIKLPKLIKK
jgi:outer membrane protein OmpA-like peptidoglycan-associated protein